MSISNLNNQLITTALWETRTRATYTFLYLCWAEGETNINSESESMCIYSVVIRQVQWNIFTDGTKIFLHFPKQFWKEHIEKWEKYLEKHIQSLFWQWVMAFQIYNMT